MDIWKKIKTIFSFDFDVFTSLGFIFYFISSDLNYNTLKYLSLITFIISFLFIFYKNRKANNKINLSKVFIVLLCISYLSYLIFYK